MANINENAYSALPQSMSDSESEKEVGEDDNDNDNDDDDVLHQRKYHPHASTSLTSISTHHMGDSSLSKKLTSNGYKCHDYDKSASDYLDETLPPMSPMRRFLFYASIVCCLLTIVIFLWVVPCTEGSICPASFEALITKNWEKQYWDKEFFGTIEVIRAVHPKRQNLAVMFRSDISRHVDAPFKGGAMSVFGGDGQEMWLVPLAQRLPVWLDCDSVDVTGNSVKDCILIGEDGLLEAIDPVTGLIHWHIHSHDDVFSAVSSVDIPLVVPDSNGDGIDDMLDVCSFNSSRQNYVVFVSGKVGNILGSPMRLADCLHLTNLTVSRSDSNVIRVNCQNVSGVSTVTLSLKDLQGKILGKNVTDGGAKRKGVVAMRDGRENESWELNGRKLIVSNRGTCPNDCQSLIQLVDVRNGRNDILSVQRGRNTLAMRPVTFSFQPTDANLVSLKGHIHGFIIKLWQWPSYTRAPLKRFWKADSGKPPYYQNSTVQVITERVILISFNSSDFHVINASQTEVMQLCYRLESVWSCQPDPSYQMNSITVVDLDKDGSQELISFSSTFVDKSYEVGMSRNSFFLVSNVKVIQLETELPKLYEATSK